MTEAFAACVIAMAAAVVLMRRAYKVELSRKVSQENGGTFDFNMAVKTLLDVLGDLEKRNESSCREIHAELDRLVDGPLFDFAEARHNLLAMYGFGGFARIVGEFSRGERAVNRAWSAAVDGYPDEARDYVTRAREIFTGLAGELAVFARQSSRP